MKIIIMTDMEGVAGVMNARDYISPDGRYYDEACELATFEVSAAVEGALEAGATDVLVVDGHGHGAIRRKLLHPRAKMLCRGTYPPNFYWGMDGTYAAAMSIGQHARSNTDGGHISHTGSFSVEEERVNGIAIGEFGSWLMTAGCFGVPVVMVSGDEGFCREARGLVPNIETAAVKFGLSRGSASGLTAGENERFNAAAVHLSPDEARARIREHAYRGIKRIPEIRPFTLDPPYTGYWSVRPTEPGGDILSAEIKSADLLDLLYAQRGKAYGEIRRQIDEGPPKRRRRKAAVKKKTATKAPASKKKVAKKAAASKKPLKKKAVASRKTVKPASKKKTAAPKKTARKRK